MLARVRLLPITNRETWVERVEIRDENGTVFDLAEEEARLELTYQPDGCRAFAAVSGDGIIITSDVGIELNLAGLRDIPICWSPTTIYGAADFTEEQSALLDDVIADHDPTAQLPRRIEHKAFLLKLDALGKYDDFMTWKAGESAAMKIFFDEEPGFAEDDEAVGDVVTALSITLTDIFTPGT